MEYPIYEYIYIYIYITGKYTIGQLVITSQNIDHVDYLYMYKAWNTVV